MERGHLPRLVRRLARAPSPRTLPQLSSAPARRQSLVEARCRQVDVTLVVAEPEALPACKAKAQRARLRLAPQHCRQVVPALQPAPPLVEHEICHVRCTCGTHAVHMRSTGRRAEGGRTLWRGEDSLGVRGGTPRAVDAWFVAVKHEHL